MDVSGTIMHLSKEETLRRLRAEITYESTSLLFQACRETDTNEPIILVTETTSLPVWLQRLLVDVEIFRM